MVQHCCNAGEVVGANIEFAGLPYCLEGKSPRQLGLQELKREALEELARIDAMGGPGSRAASTEEARAIIRHALARESIDRRVARGTALQLLVLFAAAARASEPGKWRRRHLALEHSVPHVHWTADINKNRKEQWIALAPELAEQLRLHLRRQDAARAEDGRGPASPDDPVFEQAMQDQTLKLYAAGAGIAAHDWRGRKFSGHSAPKWFCTTLGQLVEQKMVDHLKRHTGSVPARYFDPSLADQAAALAKLPQAMSSSVMRSGQSRITARPVRS